ncbi:MAG: hypothetical protein HYT37_03055 [Candidatus Sungbacteria bacterium]|nr:hypothetical protein [Candidatus Sungbacteria bacterium]
MDTLVDANMKNFAVDLALEAGALVKELQTIWLAKRTPNTLHSWVQNVLRDANIPFNTPNDPIWVLPTNFKTIADDASNFLICDALQKRFPEHSIYSEESDFFAKTTSEYCWVVDALDGTIGFLSGITDHFTVSIGLVKNKKPVMGVIYAPKRNDLYIASEGRGSTHNGQPISVSDVTDINKVLMGVDSGKTKRTVHLPYLEKLLQEKTGITCPFMTACATVPLCMVADGRMHAYLATSLAPEDMAAAVCIIREAGGKATNLSGKEWTIGDPSILAANQVLHQKLCEFLNL